MRLKKGVRIIIAIISVLIAAELTKANVNVTMFDKNFYNIIFVISINLLANFKY